MHDTKIEGFNYGPYAEHIICSHHLTHHDLSSMASRDSFNTAISDDKIMGDPAIELLIIYGFVVTMIEDTPSDSGR